MARRPVNTPLLNPVLALLKEPVPEPAQGGGQGEAGVVAPRLQEQRRVLSRDCREIVAAKRLPLHAGKLHLVARMFDDSFATTWTPRGLFDSARGWRLVAPFFGGYLVEADFSRLASLASFIETATSIEARTAISRVQSIKAYDSSEVLRGSDVEEKWGAADEVDGGRSFVLWLAPFVDQQAKDSVVAGLSRAERDNLIRPTFPQVRLLQTDGGRRLSISQNSDQTSIARAGRRYRNEQTARVVVTLPSVHALGAIIASGTSHRVDPVRRIEVTAPNIGSDPSPPEPNAASQPIVAVVDGGLTATSYQSLEAWRAPAFIPNRLADHAHGNRVTSLVVHAYAWNSSLQLPDIDCRFATIQAVPKAGENWGQDLEKLVVYLREIAQHFSEAKVWNLSFNHVLPEDDGSVSYLGHEIAKLAREFGILPVISIGNRQSGNANNRLCGPADCEAALTVAGRGAHNGKVAGACSVSTVGPGPDGMLKPDLSWFSQLRTVGGGTPVIGSSYAAPLISSLAAHTFANLKDPSADVVRALLIDRAELEAHSPALGWGTPWNGTMPWQCEPGTVTMAWRASLMPGYAYYWNEIPIPPELIRNGKLYGRARLTAILRPVVSDLGGANYFATRLQVALQYSRPNGQVANLLGSMREDKDAELLARVDLAKWQPIRRHMRDFTKRGGVGFGGTSMKLHARVFARDLFQFGIANHQELGEQDVAFVLTLASDAGDGAIYDSTARILSNYVESAVLTQEISLNTRA